MSALREKQLGRIPDERRFLAFLEGRPADERWQLIDGVPIAMMTPPTLIHQRIAFNLAQELNSALDEVRPDLFALVEVGLAVAGRDDYRPTADVAVIDAEATDARFATRFFLAAEIVSPSNTAEHIGRKRELYAEAPDCLHVLILSQAEIACEVWSRAAGWQGRVFRSAEDRIELLELGLTCRLGDLYRGTPVT
ncbi:Uma2 family endonuclease [Mangrovicella endophytica]|uniref:Uma2 family endonuclease n=1 Tax=Mangrovicella endophytica TaxID=2066697 RepID=UPI000C9E422C|nr:Uma2 family endonuclease [Mangrovicella endophytica]